MVERLTALEKKVVADPDAPSVRSGTMLELWPDYEPVLSRRVEAETRHNYQRYMDWFLERFGRFEVSSLRASDVEDAAASEGWSNNTRRLALCVVRGFVRWAGRPNFRLKYPPGKPRGAEVLVSPEELEALLSDARGDFRPLLSFWSLTGCRPGEARKLTAADIDWKGGTINVRDHKLRKKGKERIIFLCPNSLSILKEQREKYPSGPLFRDRYGKQFSAHSIKQRMIRLRKRVGVKNSVICYSLRHTFVTKALEAGVPDSDVAALVGHSSTAMIHKVYSHLSANAKRLKAVAAKVNGSGQE
jgi:integrase